ncbi:hypothetical protein EXIGLDRAFT_762323 [Exidia glandulosa HHB12029]|uniref:Enterotoxin n=1 Tax=Exidia glandulosa HHB12029 TaxID=1314781 RepID=A0A165MWH2_EXIGL|nr:hypothetical protein EXIGLDRAFT_762323 [Exidia glandulosa HHB12029]
MKILSLFLLLLPLAAAIDGSNQNGDDNPPPNADRTPLDETTAADPDIPHQTAWELGHNECTAWPHIGRFFVRRWSSATTSWIAPNSASQSLPPPPTVEHGPEGCGCSGGWNGRFETDVYGPTEREHMWTWMSDWADHPDRPSHPYRAWIPDVWAGGGPCPRLTRWHNLWQGFPGETIINGNFGYRFAGAVEKEMRRADEVDAQLVALIWPDGATPPELALFDDEVFNGVPTYQDLRAAWGRWVQRSLDRRGRIVYELFWGEQRDWIMDQLPDVWVELRRLDYWGRTALGAWYHNTRESADLIRRHISYGVPVVYRWIPEFDDDDNLRDLAPRSAPSADLETLPVTPPNRRVIPLPPRGRDTPYTHRHTRRAYWDEEQMRSTNASPVARDLPSVDEDSSALDQDVDAEREDDAVSLGLSSGDRFEAQYVQRNATPTYDVVPPVADAVVVDSGMTEQFNVFVRARRDVIIEAISAEEAAVRYQLRPESFHPISMREARSRYGMRPVQFTAPQVANVGASGSSLAVENAIPARTVSSSPRSGSSSRGRSSSSSRGGPTREPVLLTRMRHRRSPSRAGSSRLGVSLSDRLSAPGAIADDSSDSQAVFQPERSFANTPAGVHEPNNGHADWTFVLVDTGPATDRFRALLESGDMATHESRVRYALEHHLPYATAFLHVPYRGQLRTYDSHQVPEDWFIREGMTPTEMYEAWRLGVFRILRRGHARAALARGGLIARIAEMGGVTVNEALNGPSEDARSNGSPYTYRTLGGRDLVDDWLSEDEVSILLGRVGRGGSSSLWPSPRIVYRGNDDEAWEDQLEAWFTHRWLTLNTAAAEDFVRSHKSWRGVMNLLNGKRNP